MTAATTHVSRFRHEHRTHVFGGAPVAVEHETSRYTLAGSPPGNLRGVPRRVGS
jgi:hypothetical protein